MSARTALMVSALAVLLLILGASVARLSIDTVFGVLAAFVALTQFVRDFMSPARRPSPQVPQVDYAPSRRRVEYRPFEAGLYGGLAGGTAAGVLIAIAYVGSLGIHLPVFSQKEYSIFSISAAVIGYSSLSGALLGSLTEIGLTGASTRVAAIFGVVTARLFGSIAGGIVTGAIMGPVGGWYFGQKFGLPVPNPAMVVLATGPAVVGIILCIAVYRPVPVSGTLLGNAILSTVGSYIVFSLLLFAADSLGVISAIEGYFIGSTRGSLIEGGLWFGTFCGAVVGMAIGSSALLTDWSRSRSEVRVR